MLEQASWSGGSTRTHETILAAWRRRDALRGREVAWDGGSGVADGVDDRGGLVVVVPGGDRVVLDSGEVHLTVADPARPRTRLR